MSESSGKQIIQVGILVEDVEESARKLEKLGIGPFRILEPEYRDLTFHGKVGRFKVKIALANAGPVQIELAQRIYGETVYDDYFNRKGYGLHHLGIQAENMEHSVKEMEKKGIRVIQSGNRPGVKWAFLDTEDKTGIVFELIEKK
ncbi:MAG: VOC family protein [Candidatus Bathyarchaeia archaeon]